MYGNGGLKLWTRKFVNEMKTHENSDPTDKRGLVEFCFDEYYYQFRDLCKLIDLKLLQNKNILVHCSSGRTRGSTLILAYLMYKLRKKDKNEIYKLLATKYQMVPLEKNVFSTAIRKWDEEMKI